LHEFKKNLSPEERELTETAFAAAVSRPASVVAGRTVSGVVRLVDAEAGRAVIAPDTGTPGFVVVQVTPGGIGAKDLHENQHVVAEIDAGAEHEPLAAKIVK
jgi:cold shock CspA family protein